MVVFDVLTSRHGVSSQLRVFELGAFSSAKCGRFRSVLLDDLRFLFKLCLCKTSLDIIDKFAKWINNSVNNLKTEFSHVIAVKQLERNDCFYGKLQKNKPVCPLWRFARALEAIKVRVQLKRYIFCNRRFPVQYPRLYGVKLEYLNIFKAPIKKSRKKIPHTLKIVWFLCCRRLLSELGQGV